MQSSGSARLPPAMVSMRRIGLAVVVTFSLALGVPAASGAADYKPEFRLSLVISQDSAWGRAATRFADILRHRTQGRINITNYFDGQLFAGRRPSSRSYKRVEPTSP